MKNFIVFSLLLVSILGLGCEDEPPISKDGRLIVQLFDSSDNPVEGATITTEPSLPTPIPTENAGEYKIEKVPPGTYTVHAKKDDSEGEGKVTVGAEESIPVKIKIYKPTIIDVEVLYDDDGPVPGVNISTEPEYVNGQGSTDVTGTVSLKLSITEKQTLKVIAKKGEIVKKSDISVMPEGHYKETFHFSKLPPRCQITDPEPDQKVPWRYAVKGKVSKDVVELIEKLKPNLAPGERIEMGVYVWDPNDPHGPYRQYPAQVRKDGTWAQSEKDEMVDGVRRGRSYFGNQDTEASFKVRAQLEKYKEDLKIPVGETKGEMIEDVFCEIEDVIRE